MLIGDMNGRFVNSEVACVLGKWSVDGVNKNGEYLVNICTEKRLLSNHLFSA